MRLREAHILWVSEKSVLRGLGLRDRSDRNGEKCMRRSFRVCSVCELL